MYWLKQFTNRSRTTYGPKNPFSGSSSKVLKGFFDRFEKFSFSMILGRLKVKIESKNHGFPCVFPIEIIMGKSSLPTLARPKITENGNFLDRSKTSFITLLELTENGFLGP